MHTVYLQSQAFTERALAVTSCARYLYVTIYCSDTSDHISMYVDPAWAGKTDPLAQTMYLATTRRPDQSRSFRSIDAAYSEAKRMAIAARACLKITMQHTADGWNDPASIPAWELTPAEIQSIAQ